jgi:hypothetical protein
MTTANEVEVIPPQPRKVARWFKQVHYQNIGFIAERTGNLDTYARRIAVEDRRNRKDFAWVH